MGCTPAYEALRCLESDGRSSCMRHLSPGMDALRWPPCFSLCWPRRLSRILASQRVMEGMASSALLTELDRLADGPDALTGSVDVAGEPDAN